MLDSIRTVAEMGDKSAKDARDTMLSELDNKIVTGDTVIKTIHSLSNGQPYKLKVIVATNKTTIAANQYSYSVAYYGWLSSTRGDSYNTIYIDSTLLYRFFTEIPTSGTYSSDNFFTTENSYKADTIGGSSSRIYKDYISTVPAGLGTSGKDILDSTSSFYIDSNKKFLATVKSYNTAYHSIIFVVQN